MRLMILLAGLSVALPVAAQEVAAPDASLDSASERAPVVDAEATEQAAKVAEPDVDSIAEAPASPAMDSAASAHSEAPPPVPAVGGVIAPLPDGIHPLDPLDGDDGDSATLEVSGFVDADLHYLRFDGGAYRMTFRPRELELTLDARWGGDARAVLDMNFMVHTLSGTFQNTALDQKLIDALVEQGYVEWSPGLYRFAMGKVTAPMGYEALDVVERGPLTRSNISVLATPDHFTGLMASTVMNRQLDAYVLVANGWDATVDGNRSKSVAAGVGHRLGPSEGGRWFYEGSIDGVIGAEQMDNNELRWLVDYWAEIMVRPCLLAIVELVYAGEEGRGLSGRTGLPNSNKPAIWWGGALTLDWQGKHAPREAVEDLRVVLRGEYLHDPDLAIGLPQLGGLNPMTTLLGLSATVRYELAEGLEAGVEYRVDYERGDVNNVSVQRNVPEFWNWFRTQQVTAAVIGQF